MLKTGESDIKSYTLPGFEGPLDLLLHLVQKNKYDIVNIPISELLEQYVKKIEDFKQNDIQVAVEFLEMMSRLVYIKSALLLPKHEDEPDLREQLSGELIEYQLCKKMAQKLGGIFVGWDLYVRECEKIDFDETYRRMHDADVLKHAYMSAVGRGRRRLPPEPAAFHGIVEREVVPVSQKIISVLRSIYSGAARPYSTFFDDASSRSELVATFLAMLELVKANRIIINGSGDDQMVSINKSKNRRA